MWIIDPKFSHFLPGKRRFGEDKMWRIDPEFCHFLPDNRRFGEDKMWRNGPVESTRNFAILCLVNVDLRNKNVEKWTLSIDPKFCQPPGIS